MFLVFAIGCDCATAIDPDPRAAEVASSLRVSSLVVAFTLASPSILRGRSAWTQRVLLGGLLAFLALAGDHEGSMRTRTGDSVYTLFVLLVGVQIYGAGGVEASSIRPDNVRKTPHMKQTVSALCGSLFFYVGLRGVRSAFVAASEAASYEVHFVVNGATFSSQGYAYSSVGITAPLAFGHGILACAGLLVLFHGDSRLAGSSEVAFELGASAVATAICALWALLNYAEQLDVLRVLYGPHACSGDRHLCHEAFSARRFALANASTTGLWAASLAAAVFSFAVERRSLSDAPTRAEQLWRRELVGVGTVFLVLSSAAVFLHASTEGGQWHTDVCAVACLLGIFVSFAASTLLGTGIYVVASAYEEVRLLVDFGVDRVFVHLTHCTLFVLLLLLAAHLALSLLKSVLLRYFAVARSSPINKALAYVATFGASLATVLYVASVLLLAASDGALPEDKETIRDGSGSRTMISFAISHFAPVFIWMPLYTCRCETQLVSNRERVWAWLLAMPVIVLVYVVVLGILNLGAPSAKIVHEETFLVVGVAGVLAWASAAFV